jgi:hypothetical protein
MFDSSAAVKTAFEARGIAVKSVMVDGALLFNVEDVLQPFGALEQLRSVIAELRRKHFDVVYNGTRWYVSGYTGLLFTLLRTTPVQGLAVYNALVRDIWRALIAEARSDKTEQAYIKALLHFSKPKVPVMLLSRAIHDAVKRRAPTYRYEWYRRAVVHYAVAIYFGHPLVRDIVIADYGGFDEYRLKRLDYESRLKRLAYKEVYNYIDDVYSRLAMLGSHACKIAEFGISKAPAIMMKLLSEPLAYLSALVAPEAIEVVCNAHRTLSPLLSATDPEEFQRIYARIARDAELSAVFQLPAIAELWQARQVLAEISEF